MVKHVALLRGGMMNSNITLLNSLLLLFYFLDKRGETMKLNTQGWNNDAHIIVAVSTGIDSMTLLHSLLNQYRDTYKTLTCVHVNHGLRAQSVEEEIFLNEYCQKNQIKLYVKHLDLSKIVDKGNSIQNEARRLRYQWFGEVIRDLNADVLLTAHHLDDQLETILYRVLSGRSTRSSLGMSDISNYEDYLVCRPLLNIYKKDIINYQEKYQVPYFEDSSNQDTKYVRNDIRQRIIPSIDNNPFLDSHHLLKLKEWHDNELQLLKEHARYFVAHFVSKNDSVAGYTFSREAFNRLNPNVKTTVMDQLLEDIVTHSTISQKTYDEWFQQIQNEKSQFHIDITDKWIIQIAYDTLIIMANTEMSDVNSTQVIEVPHTYRFGDYEIEIQPDFPFNQFPLTIRQRQNGDRFLLNGYTGKHKKVSRLLIDKKIDAIERNRLPVVINAEGKIIAVGQLFMNKDYKHYINIRNIGDE